MSVTTMTAAKRDLFTARLEEACLVRNLGPIELEERTGISLRTLYYYTSGVRVPRIGNPHRQQLADALGVNVGWLNGFDEPRDKRRAPRARKSQDK